MLGIKKRFKKSKKNKAAVSVNSVERTLDIKEKLAQKRKIREARKKLFSVLGISIFFAIIIGIPSGIVGGIQWGLLVGLGLPIAFAGYNYPRMALWIFLIYMPFSGTITYWVGGGNALFQLSKDIFYIPALLGLVQECRRKRLPIVISRSLMISFGVLIFTSLLTLFFVNGLNQLLPACDSLSDYEKFLRDASGELILDAKGIVIKTPCKVAIPFLQGLLGLKVLIGYVPLIFCAYYLIEDKKKLLTLGRLLVILAIICCVLGLAQYWMLKTGRCEGTNNLTGLELFQPQLDAKCLVGGALLYSPSQGQIRLPGTFVSPWHWSWFLVGNAGICFTVAFSDTALFWRNCGLVGMGLVFINAVICGQRLAFAAVPGIIIILLFLTGQIANLKRFIPIGIGLALVTFIGFSFFNPEFIQERIDSFVGRWNNSPPYYFAQEQLNFALINQKGLFGNGLGTATNSTRVFGEVSLVETYHPKLLYEMGWPGLLGFLIFVTHLSYLGFKSYRSVKDKSLRSFASSFWVFMLIIAYFPYWYPLDTDPVAVYYWLFAGIVLKLPIIDKQEQKKLKEEKEREAANKKIPKVAGKNVSVA